MIQRYLGHGHRFNRNGWPKTFDLVHNHRESSIILILLLQDYDHDGKLSYADFEKAVRDENLLLEAFGPCLPDIKVGKYPCIKMGNKFVNAPFCLTSFS